MPEVEIMSLPDLVQDLNLDYSDRNREVLELKKRRNTVYDFRVNTKVRDILKSDSENEDSDESSDEEEEESEHEDEASKQYESEEEYFFDKGLDFNDPCYTKYKQMKDAETDEYIFDNELEDIDEPSHNIPHTASVKTDTTVKTIKDSKDDIKRLDSIKDKKKVTFFTELEESPPKDIVKPRSILDQIFNKPARRNDREEIRKKLAMGEEDDYYEDDSNDDIGYKKPSFQSRLHSGLQICFMNESPGDTDSEGRSPRQHEFHDNMKLDPKEEELVDSDNNLRTVQDLNQTASTSTATTTIQNCSPPRLKPYGPEEGAGAADFQSRQEQLQNEAKLALAQAGTMAHMQLEIEKQLQKKSPMAEIVGIPGLGERRRKKLSIRQLQEMNLAQIQVLYNDLHTQIENLNEELVHLLMERDELHMEQDSMLVDIEDLTRRAEEIAEKGKDVKNNVKGKLPTR